MEFFYYRYHTVHASNPRLVHLTCDHVSQTRTRPYPMHTGNWASKRVKADQSSERSINCNAVQPDIVMLLTNLILFNYWNWQVASISAILGTEDVGQAYDCQWDH